MDLKINPKSQEAWFRPLGKFVVNFGTLDLLVSLIILKIKKWNNLSISDFEVKLTTIKNAIDSVNLSQIDKKNLLKSLRAAKKINGLRNSIFHSPILGYSHSELSNDIILSTDLRKKKVVRLETIDSALNKMVDIGKVLHEIMVKMED